MKYVFSGATALLISAAPVMSGGIDRSGQFLGPLWEPGNYAEFSFAHVKPTVSSNIADVGGIGIGTTNTADVADSYSQFGLAYKRQFNDNLSGAVMLDQPFGADIDYPFAPEGSPYLGGTGADVSATELTGVVRYVMPETGFGVHGGIRALSTSADVHLGGAVFAAQGADGYHLNLDRETDIGWLAGVSWEKPEIAARVALTFNSAIEHEFDSIHRIGGVQVAPNDKTKVKMPKSVNLEFQTGIAEDTLLMGSVRWVDWSEFKVRPSVLGGTSLTNFEDSTTYTIGIGRKFTDRWSGAVSFLYEGDGDGVGTPLSPYEGKKGITLAAVYTQDNVKITTGISYVKLGAADVGVGEGAERVVIGEKDEGKVWGVGVKVGYSF
ncbi:outer membrane protein transport protein [Paracoccus saliphilus]|uniref:Long-chain fatty acid transport protein n=1 Tax=Paracoccus saliphilus TaxID=405559 RepID=A0AA45W1T3_9RHOB|nr:outer membrane protein transport protein [Paracoccus saliphilus]WCR01701.1 outer membrane protein transport protein [Paracoccus saliphilus]SIS62199.1 Long-chain fatty acid transport protein [Paracoccus saliphilus]